MFMYRKRALLQDMRCEYFRYIYDYMTNSEDAYQAHLLARIHIYSQFARHKGLVDKFFLQLAEENILA